MTVAASEKLVNHAGLRESVQQTLVMAYRTLLRIKRRPEELVDVLVQPIMFTLMFVYIFGGAISGDPVSYLPIVIPGILVQSVIMASVSTGSGLRDDMDKGVFDRFRSLPISRMAPLVGASVANIVRFGIVIVLTFAMGFVMGLSADGGVIGVLAAALLVTVVSWCISWVFVLVGVMVKSATSVTGISMIILFPLTFLSNAFVPVDTLPSVLGTFASANPVSYLVTAVRELISGAAITGDLWMSIAGAAVIALIFAPLATRAYTRKA
ncbi:MAG: ABC transporter permease [Candidatus Methanoplasma sp.]|jgi:ABC-2 type transport system permease protein|nr:ABC transporter permease [Candidatus Methanoplasma sp.]